MSIPGFENGGKGMEGYFAFLRERYTILLKRRAGLPAPWTEDPVLREWRFCNVRREDDRVTEWFRENIREPLRDDPSVLFATIAFRWFNTIEVGGLILKPWLLEGRWDRVEIQRQLEEYATNGGNLFTGAFMVNSRPGKPKHVDVLDNLDWVREHLGAAREFCVVCDKDYGLLPTDEELAADLCPHCGIEDPESDSRPWTKEAMMKHVLRVPRLGNFSAYQVVVDLQYTYLLEGATDFNTFTVAGPGCARGIGLAYYDDAEMFRYGVKTHQVAMLQIMRDYLEAGNSDPKLWPRDFPRFCLSDIENGFCEYMKWRTGHLGVRLKRRYKS